MDGCGMAGLRPGRGRPRFDAIDWRMFEAEVNDVLVDFTARQAAIYTAVCSGVGEAFVSGATIMAAARISDKTLTREVRAMNIVLKRAGSWIEARRNAGYRIQDIEAAA